MTEKTDMSFGVALLRCSDMLYDATKDDEAEPINRVLSQDERNRVAQAIIDNPMNVEDVINIIELSGKMAQEGYSVKKSLQVIFTRSENED
jgi:hypothetical protein